MKPLRTAIAAAAFLLPAAGFGAYVMYLKNPATARHHNMPKNLLLYDLKNPG